MSKQAAARRYAMEGPPTITIAFAFAIAARRAHALQSVMRCNYKREWLGMGRYQPPCGVVRPLCKTNQEQARCPIPRVPALRARPSSRALGAVLRTWGMLKMRRYQRPGRPPNERVHLVAGLLQCPTTR